LTPGAARGIKLTLFEAIQGLDTLPGHKRARKIIERVRKRLEIRAANKINQILGRGRQPGQKLSAWSEGLNER